MFSTIFSKTYSTRIICSIINGNRYRVLETKAEGKLYEGVNLVTYVYYNGIPKRIFINQLRTVSDYIQELYKNEDYGNYEIKSEWIVK